MSNKYVDGVHKIICWFCHRAQCLLANLHWKKWQNNDRFVTSDTNEPVSMWAMEYFNSRSNFGFSLHWNIDTVVFSLNWRRLYRIHIKYGYVHRNTHTLSDNFPFSNFWHWNVVCVVFFFFVFWYFISLSFEKL